MTTPELPTFRTPGAAARFGLDGYDESTYGDGFADVYDEWYDDLDDHDFIDVVAAALPPGPSRVLELGVGTGRLIEKLRARRGNVVDDVTGVDSSDAMLTRARTRLGHGATLVRSDFSRELPAGPFDGVFVGYNTLFNLPDEPALESCLRLVASRLSPGGVFLVDATCPADGEPAGPDSGESTTEHVGIRSMRSGEIVLTASRHDPIDRRIVGQFVSYIDGERVRVRSWVVRYWPPLDLDRIARTAGLELASRTADGAGTAYVHGGTRHISQYRPRTGNLGGQ